MERRNEDGDAPVDCGAALLQGRRPRQEDRILCMVDVVLPPFGKNFLLRKTFLLLMRAGR